MTNSAAREQWDAVSEGWDRGFEWYARNIRPLTDRICDAVAVPNAHVLDVACGTGQPALAIAARVGAGGGVIATDLSPKMVAAVRRRATNLGLGNLQACEMSAESLLFDSATFSALSCCCGLMFCTDPHKAVSEMVRVLVPQGRFAIATWDEPSRNPFFTVASEAIRTTLGTPRPNWPLRTAEELEGVLRDGGFSDFVIERLAMTFELESVTQYWQLFTGFLGLEKKLAGLSPDRIEQGVAALESGIASYRIGERIRLTATALLAAGTSGR